MKPELRLSRKAKEATGSTLPPLQVGNFGISMLDGTFFTFLLLTEHLKK